MTTDHPPGDRRVSALVLLAGGVVFVALAVWLVPWQPVAGGTPAPASPGSVFTAEQIRRAEDYAWWARLWSWSSLLVSLATACWFGLTRRGRRLVDRLMDRLTDRGVPWWLRVVLAVAALLLTGRLLTLPFAVLLRREQREAGLSTQSWSGFATDQALGQLVAVVVTSLGLLVLVGCARRWRRAWPAVAGALVGLLVLAGSFAYPVLVEPLFNSFTPLPDGSLRTRILRLADAQQVRVDDVLVADASRRTTTLNAYVSGFGGTRRVVLYDNLVDDLPEDEALSVVAHELGHARYDDVLVGSVLGAAGAVLGVGLLGVLVGRLAARHGRRGGMADPAVVPLVLALLAVGSLAASPVENGISRRLETRADVTALETTGDPASFIALQRDLALRSLSDPTPAAWSHFWFASHPSTLTRIALARRYAQD